VCRLYSTAVASLPLNLPGPYAEQLRLAIDREGKIARAIEALGSVADADVALVDAEGSDLAHRLEEVGARLVHVPLSTPFRTDLPDASADVVLSPWAAFRGPEPSEVAEADRILRPGGRLLVIHDYGRDDVSRLRGDQPEYGLWTRRDGPFLRGGFKIRVLHCFWTWDAVDEARAFLEGAFGEAGAAVATEMNRPRLSYNVAVYHRPAGGA
jgi:hypothetical protein